MAKEKKFIDDLTEEEFIEAQIKMANRGDIEFRVGTFKEDIFTKGEDVFEIDVIFFYLKYALPRIFYYDTLEYKFKNTFETIAYHIASGGADNTLLLLMEKMDMEEDIFLLGINDPICTKKQLMKRVKEIRK